MSEYKRCPFCNMPALDTVYDTDRNGAVIEANECCFECGFERDIDMITGEQTVLYMPGSDYE